MSDVCRWHRSNEVPGGRFLVPGCWNRAVHGDYADCHCPKPPKRLPKAARELFKALATMRLDDDQIDEGVRYLQHLREIAENVKEDA